MPLRLVQIDAFTDRPFTGNPAAVCVVPEGMELGDEAMQTVAREMNLSETAFLRRRVEAGRPGDSEADERIGKGRGWDLRWFTPGAEVELCGHATLASAHHLWESGQTTEGAEIRFHTLSGVLTASRSASGDEDVDGPAWIELDFPAQGPEEAPAPAGMLEALGVAAEWVGTNGTDWLVEVCGEAAVRAAEPDLSALKRVPARGVIVTAAAAEPDDSTPRPTAGRAYDFVSRFFAPAVGVPEDPVTGSAHCCLAPFWAARLGTAELVGYQASARGGFVRVHHRGERVLLAGRAVTVLTAEMVVTPSTA